MAPNQPFGPVQAVKESPLDINTYQIISRIYISLYVMKNSLFVSFMQVMYSFLHQHSLFWVISLSEL